MKKQTFKVGVASLAVTAILASTSVTGAFAAKSNQLQSIDWNKNIVKHMLEQLNYIQQKHGINHTEFITSNNLKIIIDKTFAVIENEIKPVTKPVVTPEVKPEEKPAVTPEVKPEEKPAVTPEVKPEEKPAVTPEVKLEEKPAVTPEVKPEEKPAVTPEVKPEEKPVVTPEIKPEETTDKITDKTFTAEQQEVLSIVNKERTALGLKPLELDAAVSAVATEKARDMDQNNYFNHQSPTYGSPFDMLTKFGVDYSYAGENIASGQRNPEEVMTAWMNSTGHRNNILSANFTKIGVGYVNGKWVQLFIG